MATKKLPQDRGYMGDRTRGASMGRESRTGIVPDNAKWALQRVRLNSGGYDGGGAYWGAGLPLYWATEHMVGGEAELFFRAAGRDAAKAHVRALYPNARFHR